MFFHRNKLSKASPHHLPTALTHEGVSLIETALCIVLVFVTIAVLAKNISGQSSNNPNNAYSSTSQELGVKNKVTILANSLIEDVLAGRFTETDVNRRFIAGAPPPRPNICDIPIENLRNIPLPPSGPGLTDNARISRSCQDTNSSTPIFYRWDVRRLFYGNGLDANASNTPCDPVGGGCFKIASRNSRQTPNAPYNEYYLGTLTFFNTQNNLINNTQPTLSIPFSFAINNFVPDPVNANVLVSIAFDASANADVADVPGELAIGTSGALYIQRQEILKFLDARLTTDPTILAGDRPFPAVFPSDPFLSRINSRVTAFGVKGTTGYGPFFNGGDTNTPPVFYDTSSSPGRNIFETSLSGAIQNVQCFTSTKVPTDTLIQRRVTNESNACPFGGRGAELPQTGDVRSSDDLFNRVLSSHRQDITELPQNVDPNDFRKVSVVILTGDDINSPLDAAANFPGEDGIIANATRRDVTLFTIGFVPKITAGDPTCDQVNRRLSNVARRTRFGMNYEAPSGSQFSESLQSIVAHNQIFALMKKMRRYGVEL
jgi:hypothetical protein